MINAGSGIGDATWVSVCAAAATNTAQAHPSKLNLLFSHTFLEYSECVMLYFKASQIFLAKFNPPLFRVPLAGL
jgi:hypothetical protein